MLLLASENILTDLTDLERDSRKQSDVVKVTSQSVRVESATPTSRLPIWITLCFTCGGRNESDTSSGLSDSIIEGLCVASNVQPGLGC